MSGRGSLAVALVAGWALVACEGTLDARVGPLGDAADLGGGGGAGPRLDGASGGSPGGDASPRDGAVATPLDVRLSDGAAAADRLAPGDRPWVGVDAAERPGEDLPSLPADGPWVPADVEVPPADGPVFPADAVMLADRPALPADRPVLPADRPVLPADRPVLPADRPVLPADRPVLPADLPLLPADRPVLPADLPALPEDLPVLPADLPALPEDLPVLPADLPVLPEDVPPLPPDAGLLPPPDPIAYQGTFPAVVGHRHVVLQVNGLNRESELYVPAARPAHPPLLILLHGTYGTGSDFIGGHRPQGFENLADAEGLIAIAPTSRAILAGDWDQHADGERFRNYWETLPNDDPSRGPDPERNPDLLFLRAVIAEAQRAYGVDPRRVYLFGFSNGGFFAIHAAVALEARVAAFAEAGSGLVRCPNTNSCHFQGWGDTCAQLRADPAYCACVGPEKPIALPVGGRMPPGWITHATDDNIVSVVYSCDLEARMLALGHEVETHIRNRGGGHSLPATIARDVWMFLSRYSR